MQDFAGKVAVITGAASGFGCEFARIGAELGMKLMLADIELAPLQNVAEVLRAKGTEVAISSVDVSEAAEVERLAQETLDTYGAVHLLFNNAGVALGGLIWENSAKDWEWVLGVNLFGVVHGIRCFVPIMLAQNEPAHVVNTASVAGLISPQLMGVYNASKHAVVTISETLYHDLRLVGAPIGVTVLCPAFVNTGIKDAERNRPASLRNTEPPTASQLAAAAASRKAVESGRLSAAEVAERTFAAIRAGTFYCITHPRILPAVERRMRDILEGGNPRDPFADKPEVAVQKLT